MTPDRDDTCKKHGGLVVKLDYIQAGLDNHDAKLDRILNHLQDSDASSRAHRRDDADILTSSCAEHRAIIIDQLEPLQKSHDFIKTLIYVLLSALGVVATVSRLGWL